MINEYNKREVKAVKRSMICSENIKRSNDQKAMKSKLNKRAENLRKVLKSKPPSKGSL